MNVNKAIEIGGMQINSFQNNFPEGFRSKIKKEVVTIKTPSEANIKNC